MLLLIALLLLPVTAAANDLAAPLLACDGATDERVVAQHLDGLRAQGGEAREVAPALGARLPAQPRNERGRDLARFAPLRTRSRPRSWRCCRSSRASIKDA